MHVLLRSNGLAGLGALFRHRFTVARWRPILDRTLPTHGPYTCGSASRPRCLIPRFDGAILSLEWKEAVWDRYGMGAPRPRTPSEQQYSDRKLRSRR